jgi:hypothetical protein
MESKMPKDLSADQVTKLFSMRSVQDVETFLDSLNAISPHEWDWRPLGGRLNNAGNVELITEPGPPIIERATNGIDAMLELGFQTAGCPALTPVSPRAAAEQWFSIKGGTVSGLKEDRTLISKLATNVIIEVFDSGDPKMPTLSVLDKGIGQHPDDLPVTILSLGESNKIGKQYLCGAFGQGGSSSFAWCKYTAIISRKRPEHINGKSDLVGWTVVRQYDSPELKNYTYQYLVTAKKEVPAFSPTLLSGTNFDYGTYICHISYRMERLSGPWSMVGYRYFDNLLFDPVFPYTIKDYRASSSFSISRYMGGARSRLDGASVEYFNEYQAGLGDDGFLGIRYWVFKEKRRSEQSTAVGNDVTTENDPDKTTDTKGVRIESYLESDKTPGSSRTIVITLNGQRHAYLDKSFIKQSRYPLLADSLLVQVDCDQLSRQRKKGLFPATRSGIVSGEKRLELIENCIKEALENDERLKQIQNERINRTLAAVDEERESEVRRLLDRLISVTKPFEGAGAETGEGEGQQKKGEKKYRAKDPPTYFRFSEENQTLSIEAGSQRVIDVVTDGPDELLTRTRHKGKLALDAVGDQFVTMRTGQLHEGRMGITVIVAESAAVGAVCQLRCALEMDGGVYFLSQRPCQVAPPPPPYKGVEPPSKLEIVLPKGGIVRLRRGRVTRVIVRSNCKDDLLSRVDNPGQFEMRCSLSGFSPEARRGPHRGEIEAYIRISENVPADASGTLTARLTSANTQLLENTAPCVVVEPPPPDKDRGKATVQRGNYEIIPVYREIPPDKPNSKIWDDMNPIWDETYVGKYELVPDPQNQDRNKLLLYTNVDNEELIKEKHRCLTRLGEVATKRLERRYQAYIGYHLWLHFQRTRPMSTAQTSLTNNVVDSGSGSSISEEKSLYEEMRRVANTVLLAMRSERDILAALQRET